MSEDETAARQRFMVINAVRVSGVALALFGLAVIAGKFDLGREIGAFLFIVGLFEALFMPAILARRWKSPPP
jgi:hypothetical protein